MNRIRSGDSVIVTAGKSKGHIGKIKRVKDNRVWVEGANLVKKHVKPNPQLNVQGGIITREASLHVSNVAHYNFALKKADRIGFRFIEVDGVQKKVRYFKSNDQVIDEVSR